MLVGLAVLTISCSKNPIEPTKTVSNNSSLKVTTEAVSNQWPVGDGRYGWENPNYPPPTCACPSGYSGHYNGWNFVCENPLGWRELPHLSSCPK
jgi:hypothetical protein